MQPYKISGSDEEGKEGPPADTAAGDVIGTLKLLPLPPGAHVRLLPLQQHRVVLRELWIVHCKEYNSMQILSKRYCACTLESTNGIK
jgi:hypothetical protein